MGNPISWLATREILLVKDKPTSLLMATDFSELYQEVSLMKKTRGRPPNPFTSNLPLLYTAPRPMSVAKWNDLKSLMNLIPGDARKFYSTLQNKCLSSNIVEDIIDDSESDNDNE